MSRAMVLLLAVVMLVVAACGGDDSGNTSDEDDAAAAATEIASIDLDDIEATASTALGGLLGGELDPYVYLTESGGAVVDGTVTWAFIIEQGDTRAVEGVHYEVQVYAGDDEIYSTSGVAPTIQPQSRVGISGHAPFDGEATVTEVKVELDGGEYVEGTAEPAPKFNIPMGYDPDPAGTMPRTGTINLENQTDAPLENLDLVIICDAGSMVVGGGSERLPATIAIGEKIEMDYEVWCGEFESAHLILVPITD